VLVLDFELWVSKDNNFQDTATPIIALSLLTQSSKSKTSNSFRTSADSDKTDYSLKGIIYHGQYHFTSRLIDNAGGIWYHDGMTSGRECVYEGKWKDIQDIYQASGERHQSSIYIST